MTMKIIYGVRYRHSKNRDWAWNYNASGICKYEDINNAYWDYMHTTAYEWLIEELPEELVK